MARDNIFTDKSPPGAPVTVTSGGGASGDVNVLSVDPSVTFKTDPTSIVNLGPGGVVGLTPGSIVSLAAGTEVDLATGAEVGLIAGTEVGISSGALIGLVPGTEVGIAAGAQIDLVAGAEVDLVSGATVALELGTEVGITSGAEIGLVTGTTVGLVPGTEVDIASGAEIGLVAGTEVGLTAGTQVDLAAGAEVNLASDTQIDVRLTGWGDRVRSAFDRLRVTEAQSEVVANHYSPASPFFWDEAEISGSGTSSVLIVAESLQRMTVSAGTAGTRVRQTLQRGVYENGKGLAIIATAATFTSSTGITKQVGYFDPLTQTGVFYRTQNGQLSVVVESDGTEVVIPRSSWNGNKLDGTDPVNPYNVNFANSFIFFIDLEWLGVGTVRFGTVIEGELIVCHAVHHTTQITGTYMRIPNLPVCYLISNDGTGLGTTLDVICAAIQSDGGLEAIGLSRGVARFIPFNLGGGSAGDWFPLLSIRLDPTKEPVTVIPLDLSATCSTAEDFTWALLFNDPNNSIVNGTDNASWQNLTGSSVQYDLSRNTSNTLNVSQSSILLCGTAAQIGSTTNRNLNINWFLSKRLDGTTTEFILAVNPVTSNESFIATLDFREVV